MLVPLPYTGSTKIFPLTSYSATVLTSAKVHCSRAIFLPKSNLNSTLLAHTFSTMPNLLEFCGFRFTESVHFHVFEMLHQSHSSRSGSDGQFWNYQRFHRWQTHVPKRPIQLLDCVFHGFRQALVEVILVSVALFESGGCNNSITSEWQRKRKFFYAI